jgi:hypothetical protein
MLTRSSHCSSELGIPHVLSSNDVQPPQEKTMIKVFPVWLTEGQRSKESLLNNCPHNHLRFIDSFNYARGSLIHEAQDILGPQGAKILAVESGYLIRYASQNAGNAAVLWCPSSGRRYLYTHLQKPANAPTSFPGRKVKPGDLIGYLGKTGNAEGTCPHLHFGVRVIQRADSDPGLPISNKWRDPNGSWWRTERAINPYEELRSAPRVAPNEGDWWIWLIVLAGGAGGFFARKRRGAQ